ncbi:unnamed protein product [Boreogadus saida]
MFLRLQRLCRMAHRTYSDYCACPLWGEAYFAVEDMKPTFHLPNSSLHNIKV